MPRFLLTVSMLFLINVFTVSVYASENPLAGVWESKPVSSQLGRTVTRYAFSGDGTYTITIKFVDSTIPDAVINGVYTVKGSELELQTSNQKNTAQWRINGNILTLDEKNVQRVLTKKK